MKKVGAIIGNNPDARGRLENAGNDLDARNVGGERDAWK